MKKQTTCQDVDKRCRTSSPSLQCGKHICCRKLGHGGWNHCIFWSRLTLSHLATWKSPHLNVEYWSTKGVLQTSYIYLLTNRWTFQWMCWKVQGECWRVLTVQPQFPSTRSYFLSPQDPSLWLWNFRSQRTLLHTMQSSVEPGSRTWKPYHRCTIKKWAAWWCKIR